MAYNETFGYSEQDYANALKRLQAGNFSQFDAGFGSSDPMGPMQPTENYIENLPRLPQLDTSREWAGGAIPYDLGTGRGDLMLNEGDFQNQGFNTLGKYANLNEMKLAQGRGRDKDTDPDEILRSLVKELVQPKQKTVETRLWPGDANTATTIRTVDDFEGDQMRKQAALKLLQDASKVSWEKKKAEAEAFRNMQAAPRAESEFQKEIAKAQAQRVIRAGMTPEEAQKFAAKEAGVVLKPDERYDPKTQTVSPVSGSALWQKQQTELAQAEKDATSHQQGLTQLQRTIETLVGKPGGQEHPGLAGAVGPMDARLPWWMTTPNQNEARAFINSLLSQSAVAGLQGIRQTGTAPGSITVQEWPIFQNLIATLDPTQGEESFKNQLRQLLQTVAESGVRTTAALQAVRQRYPNMTSMGSIPITPAAPATPTAPAANTQGIMQEAQQAIARGADPAAVRARLQQMGINLGQ